VAEQVTQNHEFVGSSPGKKYSMQIISGTAIGNREVAEQGTHGPKFEDSKLATTRTILRKTE
jgi:hypothetical protein